MECQTFYIFILGKYFIFISGMIIENKNEGSTNEQKICGTNAKFYFREYCQNTSIHGFKYLSDNQKRLHCER